MSLLFHEKFPENNKINITLSIIANTLYTVHSLIFWSLPIGIFLLFPFVIYLINRMLMAAHTPIDNTVTHTPPLLYPTVHYTRGKNGFLKALLYRHFPAQTVPYILPPTKYMQGQADIKMLSKPDIL